MFRTAAKKLAVAALTRVQRTSSRQPCSFGHLSGEKSAFMRAEYLYSSFHTLASRPSFVQSASGKLTPADIEFATGLEREELEAQAKGATRFETGPPSGPFGTKEAPAIVESQFDERIVGCSGGFAEEEHDIVWFKLTKDEPYECGVCSQVYSLKVVGHGGLPGAHH